MTHSRALFGSSLCVFGLCFACSNSTFEAGGVAGSADSAGSAGAAQAGSSDGGDSSAAGSASGGASGSTDVGGTTSAGAGGTVTGTGGSSAGSGAAPAGGTTSTGGTGAADCVTLKAEYGAAVTKARVCDAGSMDECSTSSTLPTIGCGCPTLVNAKSQYTTVARKLYDQIQAAKCNPGAICNIACVAATSASCAAPTSGTDMAYVCTSGLSKAN